MPDIRHFVVTETRSVKVSANNAEDAARIANKAFGGTPQVGLGYLKEKEGLDDIWGDTNSHVRQVDLHVTEGH